MRKVSECLRKRERGLGWKCVYVYMPLGVEQR
jgi:hypothetical protein